MSRNNLTKSPALIVAVAALLAMGGCAGEARRGSATRPAAEAGFGGDAELVFRRQNRVFDELIARAGTDEGSARFAAAESRLAQSCRYVNAAAAAVQTGQDVGVMLKLEAMRTLKSCEATTRQVWQLLGHDPSEDPLAAPVY